MHVAGGPEGGRTARGGGRPALVRALEVVVAPAAGKEGRAGVRG